MNTIEERISWSNKLSDIFYHLFHSTKNLVKSSILSLLVIFIVLLLFIQMDQTFTKLVDLIETKWLSKTVLKLPSSFDVVYSAHI